MVALPGAVTATEVQAALEMGLTTLKFFPAGTSGGAKAIAALAAPFGGVRFVPTGGVGPGNLADYLALPAVQWGAAHGALAMTTPGDTSMATRAEVLKLAGGGARVDR